MPDFLSDPKVLVIVVSAATAVLTKVVDHFLLSKNRNEEYVLKENTRLSNLIIEREGGVIELTKQAVNSIKTLGDEVCRLEAELKELSDDLDELSKEINNKLSMLDKILSEACITRKGCNEKLNNILTMLMGKKL